ncbi:MAG: asparagine synthase (glutamine-hydrolyzing), partial [Nitrospirae bacterium]
GLERTVDAQALRQYLTFLYVPSPRTIFEGIRQLPPGHILTLTRGEVRVRRYWSLRPDPEAVGLGAEEAEERLLAHLKEAIRLHLISDVPLGVFLSGGMDSTTLVALMRMVSDSRIRTFTIGYGG